jgi:1-phosphofructokinase family hexose kinase
MKDAILTLTVNPALDRIMSVDRLAFEDRAYIESKSEAAGGRGINAARVLTAFSAQAIAVTTSGGDTGRKFEQLLGSDTFAKEIVKVRNGIRVNLTVSDRQGLSIKLNEIGPEISAMEQRRLIRATEKLLPEARWLMLCGSVPPGVEPNFYSQLVRLAAKHDVRTLVDTDADPLLHTLEAKPTIVKPNQSEAERLLNSALITRSQQIEAVQKIKALGPESVVISLGSRGVIAASSTEGILEVIPPPVDSVCPIGAGDAMSAAIVWSLHRGDSFSEALRWGVAAGTASSKLPGVSLANFKETEEVYPHVQITRIVL